MHESESPQPENVAKDTVAEWDPTNVVDAVIGTNPYRSQVGEANDGSTTSTGAPGPGIGESLLWTLSCPMIQVVATIIFVMFLSLYLSTTGGSLSEDGLQEAMKTYSNGLITFVQAAFVLWALVAVTLRVGRPWSHKLNLSPIDPLHFVLIVVLVMPLAVLS